MSDEPRQQEPSTSKQPLPASVMITAGILLAVPVLALMIVGIYARTGPELFGFPFFYWYQFVWVFLASGFTWAANRVIVRARYGEGRR